MAQDGHRDTEPQVVWKAACSDAEAASWQQGMLRAKAAGECQLWGWGMSWGRDTTKAKGRAQSGSLEAETVGGRGRGANLAMSSGESLPL